MHIKLTLDKSILIMPLKIVASRFLIIYHIFLALNNFVILRFAALEELNKC